MPPIDKNRPAPETPPPVLVSVTSLRASHGLTVKRTYGLMKAGEIKSVMLGGRRFVLLASVNDYIARLLAVPTTFEPTPNPRRRNAAA